MISNAAQYALRAVAHIAANGSDEYVPVRTIADDLQLPRTFLAKVLKQLVDADLLLAYRGPTGGVKLARPASDISVRTLLEAIDGPGLFTECILGLPGCGECKPCPMHAGWANIRDRLAAAFEKQTIASLASDYRGGETRLRA